MASGGRVTRQLAKWTAGLEANGWAVEYFEGGLLKSSPDGGREGHGGLAICPPGVAIAFDGPFGRLGSARKSLWEAVQLFDATDDSYRIASFGLGLELGAITFMSDRPWFPNPGAPFRGPRNDIAESVRSHLPSDGWGGPFSWSIHSVTKTKEELAKFLLRFLSTNARPVAAWQVVPAQQVAARCIEVLGQAEAKGLFEALALSSLDERVAALDLLSSLQDSELLLVWFQTLAGRVTEGVDYEATALSETRGQLVSSLRESLS